MTNCKPKKMEAPSPAAGKKKRTLLYAVIGGILLIIAGIFGGILGVVCSYTEKRAPFPEVRSPGMLEQTRLMMKVVKTLKKTIQNRRNGVNGETLTIVFTPREMQTLTRIASSFGIVQKKWGKLFFKVDYVPEKKLFQGKGILHVEKPFLRGRQIVVDTTFQAEFQNGRPVIRIRTLSAGGLSFPSYHESLAAKLEEAITNSLAQKGYEGVVSSFLIGEDGKVTLTLSLQKFLAGPGKMLLFLM